MSPSQAAAQRTLPEWQVPQQDPEQAAAQTMRALHGQKEEEK
jgi:hypothetical protein